MISRRSINWVVRGLNALLAAVALGVAALLGQSLLAHQSLGNAMPGLDEESGQRDAHSSVMERSGGARPSMPGLSYFQVIVDRDPFKSPQEAVASVPVKPFPASVVPPLPKVAVPRPPLPPLSVTLSGTIAIGDERKAILKDDKQEDLYVVGQPVASGILAVVEDDRVVIVRGNERTELRMKSAMDRTPFPLAAQGAEGKGAASENMAVVSSEKKHRSGSLNKPMFSTPAFARYPGAIPRSKGDHDR